MKAERLLHSLYPVCASLVVGLAGCEAEPLELMTPPTWQGNPPSPLRMFEVDDVRTQNVDVLFVLDGSVTADREERVAALEHLLRWAPREEPPAVHLGVVGLGVENNPGLVSVRVGSQRPNYVTSTHPDAASVLARLLASVQGSSDARGAETVQALWDTGALTDSDRPFVREGSILHVVFMTDLDDLSADLYRIRTDRSRVVVHHIPSPEEDGSCKLGRFPAYEWRARLSGGFSFSSCSLESAMMELARDLDVTRREVFLSHVPSVQHPIYVDWADSRSGSATWSTTDVCLTSNFDGCDALYAPGRNSVVFSPLVPAGVRPRQVSYLREEFVPWLIEGVER